MKCGMKWAAIGMLLFGLAAPLMAQEVTVIGSKEEPMSFVFAAADLAAAVKVRSDIAEMRESGELETIIERMRLE